MGAIFLCFTSMLVDKNENWLSLLFSQRRSKHSGGQVVIKIGHKVSPIEMVEKFINV